MYNRFGPDFTKALNSYSGIFYLILSASGALLFAQIMKALGVNLINSLLLNCVIIGLIGAGLFLGLLSRIAVNGQLDEQFANIRTLSDYIYNALNDSMNRKVDRVKRGEILKILADYDIKYLLNPIPNSKSTKGLVVQLIDINSYMTEEDKTNLYLKINKYSEEGNYALLFFELTDIKTNITMNELITLINSSNIPKRIS